MAITASPNPAEILQNTGQRRLSLRPDVRLDQIQQAERAAMSRILAPECWIVPLALALARLAAAEDIAAETSII